MADETAVFELPTLREIFYNSDLTEYTTAEYDKLSEELDGAIKAACSTFAEQDAIDSAAAAQIAEAQAIGFEQGVAFAMQILAGAAHNLYQRGGRG